MNALLRLGHACNVSRARPVQRLLPQPLAVQREIVPRPPTAQLLLLRPSNDSPAREVTMNLSQEDLAVPEPEGADFDGMP